MYNNQRILTIALLCIQLFVLVNSQCLTPLTAFGNSTIAPPVLDTQATGFTSNPLSTNANNNRLLSIRLTWATVSNRILTWAGIGEENAAGGGCQAFVNTVPLAFRATGGWYYNSTSSDCFAEVKANYTWPSALFNSSCAPLFTVDNTDATFTKITFDVIVKFNETYSTIRGGVTFNQVKTISSKLPITLQFPKTVSVSTSAVRVYSESSVVVSADLISQDVTNSPPYTITYVTLLGRSFALDRPSPTYGGLYPPQSNLVNFTTEAILGTTRQSTWLMSVTPLPSSCVLTGTYNITYNLYWTGVDANGNPLPANQNPLPNNSTVTVTFDIQSQSFCATAITSSLQATLKVYNVPPVANTIYQGISEQLGYFTNARVYFAAQVTSDNLPIRSVRLVNFFITYGTTNRTDLVINGSQSVTTAPNIDYQLSLPLTSQPSDQSLFNMLLTSDVFRVIQDQDTEYIFNALLSVSYSTTGSSKKRDLLAFSFKSKDLRGNHNNNNNNNKNNNKNDKNDNMMIIKSFDKYEMRALPVTGTTSLAATAKMTLQTQGATTPTTSAPIINSSSASGLVATFVSTIFALLIFLL